MESLASALDRRIFSRYLAPEEELIDVIHRHWLVVVGEGVEAFLLGVVLPFLLLWGIVGPWWLSLAFLVAMIGGALWTLFVIYDWYSDVFILTSQNVVLLFWKNPFNVAFTRIEYPLIESVEHRRKGLLATIFHYGDLTLATANDTHVLPTVKRPHLAQSLLLETRDRIAADESGDGHLDVETLRKALKALLAEREGEDDEGDTPPERRPPDPPQVADVRPPA
jgi:membrane protein YdbS with pleckstrin-like domain